MITGCAQARVGKKSARLIGPAARLAFLSRRQLTGVKPGMAASDAVTAGRHPENGGLVAHRTGTPEFGGKLASGTARTRTGGHMKGEKKVIQHLNAVLANELTAINQYFLHAKMFKNWGLERLAEHEYKESIDEMKHADKLMERILFLEGRPNVQLKKLLVGGSAKDVLSCDLKLELAGHPDLKEAIAHCEEIGDYVSRDLFASIIESEEGHIDWLETQLALIEKVGLQNYLQSNMS